MKTNRPSFYFSTSDEAESAFYSAFEMGDIQLMDAVLAEQGVCCIHPGSLPLVGRAEVLDSWSQILSNDEGPVIHREVLNRSLFDDIAVHMVAERIAVDHQPDSPMSLVVATNVYVLQQNGWRMMEHHASFPRERNKDSIENNPRTTHQAPHTLQ